MGCNCGGKKPTSTRTTKPPTTGTTQQFTLTTTSGRVQSFGSRLEAEAARVRDGGGSITIAVLHA
jgi:hypothetical protein